MSIPFSGSPLDRAASLRTDEAAIAALRRDPRAQVLLMPAEELAQGIPVSDPEQPELVWLDLALAVQAGLPAEEAHFLGLKDGVPHFAAALPAGLVSAERSQADLRSLSLLLPASQVAKAGLAQVLLRWHLKETRCPACGGPTEAREGGWRRQCLDEACGLARYPRTDPAVLMLITRGDYVVLGRQPQFPEGVYSCLAGYLEPGETLEECVEREAFEEVGVRVANPRYRRSQPWPLSGAVMLGFQADAQHEELKIDETELEDARWFSRRELASIMAGQVEGYRPPFRTALARILMEDWLSEG
jgi:NAD+ diphosphatase